MSAFYERCVARAAHGAPASRLWGALARTVLKGQLWGYFEGETDFGRQLEAFEPNAKFSAPAAAAAAEGGEASPLKELVAEARRAYEAQVRKLADFCRRRDPRVLLRRRQVAEAEAREAEEAERRAEEARRLFQEKRAAWLRERAAEVTDEPAGARFDPDDDVEVESEAEAVVDEEVRCEVCDKAFGSAAALARHCASKPHRAALKRRRKVPVVAAPVADDAASSSSSSSEDSPGAGLANRFAAMATE